MHRWTRHLRPAAWLLAAAGAYILPWWRYATVVGGETTETGYARPFASSITAIGYEVPEPSLFIIGIFLVLAHAAMVPLLPAISTRLWHAYGESRVLLPVFVWLRVLSFVFGLTAIVLPVFVWPTDQTPYSFLYQSEGECNGSCATFSTHVFFGWFVAIVSILSPPRLLSAISPTSAQESDTETAQDAGSVPPDGGSGPQ